MCENDAARLGADAAARLAAIGTVSIEPGVTDAEFAAAKKSLEAFVNERKGTIQGRVMLAQAM